MVISIKNAKEIEILREGGARLAKILDEVAASARPGVSAAKLDRLAESLIFSCGGRPSFKGYRPSASKIPYPASLCVSLNDEIVHAIPAASRILKEGDVVGLDIGMLWPEPQITNHKSQRGLYTDTAVTIGVGRISADAERLIRATKEALAQGIKKVRPGAKIGDVSHAIESRLKKDRLGIVRDLAGHGVGYEVHEEPLIPNFGASGTGVELKEGMVLAIEPMATLGGWKIKLAGDGWGYKTADKSLAAHFEHTVAVTKWGAEVLTASGKQ